jgi:class 3 adenylate cyclase
MNTFSALMDALMSATPERRPAIEQVINETFVRRKAVLALDMSGFSLSVRRDGILPYLCLIRQMQKLTLPIVTIHNGELVKHEADNLLAIFDDPKQAILAALAMIQASINASEDGIQALRFGIGIDYGEILVLDHVDCFGDAVNLAYKLGEDVARPGEALITERVREALIGDSDFSTQALPLSLSGLEFLAYKVFSAP